MKTKNHIITLCAVLATAASASAVTTFGASTLVSPGNYNRPIILDGTTVGSIAIDITGSGSEWAAAANFAGGPVATNTFSAGYNNNTNGSTQAFIANYSITLNSGLFLSNITIGNGVTGLLGVAPDTFAALSVNQNGTLALGAPGSWSTGTPGPYTANSAITSSAPINNVTAGAFNAWSVNFAPTNTFSYTHNNAGGNTNAALAESFSVSFDVVPEPSSLLLSGLGALGLLARRRRN